MSKRKDRKRYSKGTRQDYTQGGRVGYREGDAVEERNLIAQTIEQNRGRDEFDQVNNESNKRSKSCYCWCCIS